MTDAIGWARQFATTAAPVVATPFGSGHVNRTYLVVDAEGGRYVLQRVNTGVFTEPARLMENIVRVTTEIARQVGDHRRRLSLVPAKNGAWWLGGDECWRMYHFIAGSTELTPPVTPAEFAAAGVAFGEFLVQVAAIPATDLHVVIPHFHDEPWYFGRLKSAISADPFGRRNDVASEIERTLGFEELSHDFDATAMPLRVTHNDAKISNVLLDAMTREPLCVVDLDTVQPGYAVNDFGDAIRSGATTVPEDAPDPALVHFDIGLFAAFTRGYLGACCDVLTAPEMANLRQGARLMTLETTVRFLTDYLEGDVYYRTSYATHNRDRARNQLALLEDLQRNWQAMAAVIAAC